MEEIKLYNIIQRHCHITQDGQLDVHDSVENVINAMIEAIDSALNMAVKDLTITERTGRDGNPECFANTDSIIDVMEKVNTNIPNIDNLLNFFVEKGFKVHVDYADYSCEINKRTDCGIDMAIFINPFTIEGFKNSVNSFDVDNEIDLHRQSKEYRERFTVSESLKDFTEFYNQLYNLVGELETIF